MNRKNFHKARRRVEVSVGESIRIIRELQGLSQNGLSEITGIPQSTLSVIESDRVNRVSSGPRCWPAL
jgi:transcriptional regulator with XRE-family HTH domain